MASQLTTRVVLQEKVRFLGYGSGNQNVVIDYPPPLGDGKGLRGGLELLLMSLAVCAGQTVVALLRRMRQPLDGCEVDATAQRRDENPTILTDIHLKFQVRGAGLDRTLVERAIASAESQYCPVWAMLKASTRITTALDMAKTEAAQG